MRSFANVITIITALVLFACSSSIPMKQLDDDQIKALPSSSSALLIHFWATWCQTCLVDISALNRLSTQYQSGVQFVAVNMDHVENRQAIPGFLRKHPIHYNVVLWDGKNFEAMAQALDPEWKAGLPATFVFHGGKRIFSKIGMVDEKELDRVLQQINSKN